MIYILIHIKETCIRDHSCGLKFKKGIKFIEFAYKEIIVKKPVLLIEYNKFKQIFINCISYRLLLLRN